MTTRWRQQALALAASALLAGTLDGDASAANSPVSGFLRFDCPAGSDTVVSVPFHLPPRWSGRLLDAPVAAGDEMTLTLSAGPDFAPGELTDAPHYVTCRSSTIAAGRHFAVVSHTADTVSLAATPADLGDLGAQSTISIIPAWTLDALFPPDSQTTFHPSVGNLGTRRGSELLIFDPVTPGTQLAPARRFFITDTGWFEAGDYSASGGEIIWPGQAFVIRHRPGAAATQFLALQQVFSSTVALPISAGQSGPRDTTVGLPRPVVTRLVDLDLESVIADSASTAAVDRKDELRVFDNATAGRRKEPLAVYFRVAGQWVKDAAGFPAANDDLIDPSAGLLIRKAATSVDGAIMWVNHPRYDPDAP